MPIYHAYGLNIQSDFSLPKLVLGEGKINIHITKGKIKTPKLEATPIQRQGINCYFGGNHSVAYLHWPGVGTFLAEEGKKLIVEPEKEELDPKFLNLYILSEALGLMLFQQGYILLHGSGVKVKGRAVIFAGAAGVGKSTLAAAFSRLGYPILGDDLVAMKLTENGQVMVYPGFPQVKVWSPTVEGLKLNSETLSPLFDGSSKQFLHPQKFLPQPLPLEYCFILSRGNKLKLIQMNRQEALISLMRFFPCPGQILNEDSLEPYYQQCLQLTQLIPILKLELPNDFTMLNKFVNRLIRSMGKKR